MVKETIVSFRMDAGLLGALRERAAAEGDTVSAVITRALRSHLGARAEGEPDPEDEEEASFAAEAAELDELEPLVPRRCRHPGTRVIGGFCPQCDHAVYPGGLWR